MLIFLEKSFYEGTGRSPRLYACMQEKQVKICSGTLPSYQTLTLRIRPQRVMMSLPLHFTLSGLIERCALYHRIRTFDPFFVKSGDDWSSEDEESWHVVKGRKMCLLWRFTNCDDAFGKKNSCFFSGGFRKRVEKKVNEAQIDFYATYNNIIQVFRKY